MRISKEDMDFLEDRADKYTAAKRENERLKRRIAELEAEIKAWEVFDEYDEQAKLDVWGYVFKRNGKFYNKHGLEVSVVNRRVLRDVLKMYRGARRYLKLVGKWNPSAFYLPSDEMLKALKHQQPCRINPNDDDYLRISKSGYSVKVGWGDDKRIVAASPKPLHELPSAQQRQWLDDAARLCDGWNRTTPQAPSAQVPEGWKLVPVEPTEEMLTAGAGAVDINSHSPLATYAAMLSAAPTPQGEKK